MTWVSTSEFNRSNVFYELKYFGTSYNLVPFNFCKLDFPLKITYHISAMLSYTDLKKGTIFVYEGDPYEVLESSFLRMQQRKAVVQTRIRNLATGKLLDRN